jgi:transcriptional regulator with GAF, ATPase, and Fis domain
VSHAFPADHGLGSASGGELDRVCNLGGPRPIAAVEDLEAALARETRISTALREVGLALGTTLDLDQLLELILSKITEALEADRATLYLLDEANDELVSRIAQGPRCAPSGSRSGQGIAGHVARTGKALHVKDAYKDPRFSPEWDMLSATGRGPSSPRR